jgi:hypothetical protein
MFFRGDWLSWSYDGIKFGNKLNPNSIFEFHFKKVIIRPLKTYKEELLINTQIIRDSFKEPFDLLFSGGVDSEVILRCNHYLKIPINVFIFRYENDYNYHDIRHALRICKELNITPKIIDFNLKNFYENHAYDIWKTGQFHVAGRLPHMKMIEYLDGIPIMGDGDPHWVYIDNQWKFELGELNHSQSIYCKKIHRTAIPDWFEYSPEIILSHMKEQRMQAIVDNTIIDDGTVMDRTKYYLHNKIWPEILVRPKRNGYEKFGTVPRTSDKTLTCIQEFQKQYIDILSLSNTACYFTKDELIELLV